MGRRVLVVFLQGLYVSKDSNYYWCSNQTLYIFEGVENALNIVKTKKIIKRLNWELVIVHVVCGLGTFHLFAIMICSLLAWLASFMLNDGPTHFPTFLFVFLSVSLCLFLFLCSSACLSLFLYLREIISKQKLIDF